MAQSKKKKLVPVAKGVKVTPAKKRKMSSKKGSSNVGKYSNVSPKEFAGSSGGSSKFSYPINSLKRARSALSLAHNAPNPEGIRRAVLKKYPQLKSKKDK